MTGRYTSKNYSKAWVTLIDSRAISSTLNCLVFLGEFWFICYWTLFNSKACLPGNNESWDKLSYKLAPLFDQGLIQHMHHRIFYKYSKQMLAQLDNYIIITDLNNKF